jgi:hypothetical protein
MSPNYFKRKREKQLRKSRLGVEARERKRMSEACRWKDVGGFLTYGVLGVHSVMLSAKDDESKYLAVSVDGKARQARTLNGIKKCIAEMLWKKMK